MLTTTLNNRMGRRAVLLAAAGTAMSAMSALGQFTWANPGVSNTWNSALNWNPNGIPNGGANATLPTGLPYTVTVDGGVTVSGITIASPATVNITNGITLTMGGTTAINNSGILSLNTGGAAASVLMLQNGNCDLQGNGQLVFNALPSNLDTAQVTWWGGGEQLTNTASHTIRGTGRIRTGLVNNGTVNANVPAASFWLSDRNKVNNATMKASSGGDLYVNCRIDQDTGGVLRAEAGSTVTIAGTVFGGSIGSTGNGMAQFVSGSSIGGNTLFGQVKINDNVVVYIEGQDMVNNGTFTINHNAGPNGGYLGLRNGNTVLSGTGVLRLNASSNLDTAQITWWGGGEVLTNASGHSIRGTGRIRTSLVNESTVTADVPGAILWLSDRAKTNNSVFEAISGANLFVNSDVTQGPGGVIRCDSASSITVQGVHITGGTITTNGGSATMVANAGLISNPTLNGSMVVPDNNALYLEGSGLVNNGVVTVNPTSGTDGTYIVLRNGDGTFSGPGSIWLKARPENLDTAQITWWGGGEVVTNSATHTIHGAGRVRTSLVNQGTISGDTAGNSLWLSDRAKTNNNLMRATAGGDLNVNCPISQGGGGRIVAENASSVSMYGASVGGGQLQTVGNGVMRAYSNTHLQSLTTSADFRVPSGHAMYIDGGSTITNTGTIKLGDLADSPSACNITAINGNIDFQGSGSLILAGSAMNSDNAQLVWWGGGEIITNGAAHTIKGVGRIRTSYVNDGTTSADIAGGVMTLTDRAKTNNNIMRAMNGGTLVVACPLSQGPNGHLIALDGSTCAISGGSIAGGTLEGGPTGLITTSNSTYIGTLTNNTKLRMLPGTTYSTNATITNNGTMWIGDGIGGTAYLLQNADSTLQGNGTLLLDAPLSNTDLAQVTWWGGGERLINAAGHSIGGSGRISNTMVNDGQITPGAPGTEIGRITKTNRPLTFGSTSRLNIQVASATSFDKIDGNAALTLGGTLQVRLLNGYTGGIGTTYEIVHGGSVTGTFNLIDIPDHPTIGLKYGVQYTSNSVLLRVTCDVDFNSDGVIDLFDYLDFVDVFSTGVPDADFNADGVVDLFDYLDFLDQFARGCD